MLGQQKTFIILFLQLYNQNVRLVDHAITNKNVNFWYICILNPYFKKSVFDINLLKRKFIIRIDHHQEFYTHLMTSTERISTFLCLTKRNLHFKDEGLIVQGERDDLHKVTKLLIDNPDCRRDLLISGPTLFLSCHLYTP